MMQRLIRSALVIAVATLLNPWPRSASAQTPAGTAFVPRDSLLGCAVGLATAAGFRVAPGARSGRIGLMRPRDSGGNTSLVDAMRLSLLAPDSTGAARLQVDIKTLVISRSTGLNQGEEAPPRVLVALADSMRLRCRARS